MVSFSKKGVRDYFDSRSGAYDESLKAPWLAEMIKEMDGRTSKALEEIKGVLLDLGCGTGRNLNFASADRVIVSLDISRRMLMEARTKTKGKEEAAHLVVGDAENLPFTASSFDAVLSNYGTLNYLQDISGAIRELRRILKIEGRIIAWVHNWWGLLGILVGLPTGGLKKTLGFILSGWITTHGPDAKHTRIYKSTTIRQIKRIFQDSSLAILFFEALPLAPYANIRLGKWKSTIFISRISTLARKNPILAQFGVGLFSVGEKMK